jgi:hypothetical protein
MIASPVTAGAMAGCESWKEPTLLGEMRLEAGRARGAVARAARRLLKDGIPAPSL